MTDFLDPTNHSPDVVALNPELFGKRPLRGPGRRAVTVEEIDARPKEDPDQFWGDFVTFKTFTLWPGQFVLCHSLEEITIPLDHVGILYSKSSTGRLGLEHLHAGYADPGFYGQLTFEFSNMAPWPVRLTAGQPLMQLVFEQLNGRPDKPYGVTGRYQGQQGPTAARRGR